MKQSEMSLENIQSISYQTGLLFGAIEIWHGGSRMLIENCDKKTVKPFVDAVNAAIKELKENESQNASAPLSQSSDDVVSKLERLAALKEKGILTDEEFAEQKAKILR